METLGWAGHVSRGQSRTHVELLPSPLLVFRNGALEVVISWWRRVGELVFKRDGF